MPGVQENSPLLAGLHNVWECICLRQGNIIQSCSLLIDPQVNCYEIISESDIKTEGTLRARFDKAQNCSPCILVLRHIEALAQTTQAPEPGKGRVVITNVLNHLLMKLQCNLISGMFFANLLRICRKVGNSRASQSSHLERQAKLGECQPASYHVSSMKLLLRHVRFVARLRSADPSLGSQ